MFTSPVVSDSSSFWVRISSGSQCVWFYFSLVSSDLEQSDHSFSLPVIFEVGCRKDREIFPLFYTAYLSVFSVTKFISKAVHTNVFWFLRRTSFFTYVTFFTPHSVSLWLLCVCVYCSFLFIDQFCWRYAYSVTLQISDFYLFLFSLLVISISLLSPFGFIQFPSLLELDYLAYFHSFLLSSIHSWRGSEYTTTNMTLWCIDYFELKAIGKQQTQEHFALPLLLKA